MKAVMYGGGNIGRGFVGAMLSQSGYEVSFIDVSEPVVSGLSSRRRYPVRYVSSQGHEDVWIENVTAVNGCDREATAQAIAQCCVMATAVGVRVLPHIAPHIAAGLRKRWEIGGDCLNIIICENLMNANQYLAKLIKECLTAEECARFDKQVGLVEASIGRMVPVQTASMRDGDPLRVCVERYGFLPVDRDAFKGAIPEIQNMIPFGNFDFFVKRKLYIHNMGHAVCAYLGDYMGEAYIHEAISHPEIRLLAQNAMLESALALSMRYGAPLGDLQMHITDLLGRFGNEALQDTCQRVGGDPVRKLGPEDRLIGAAFLALGQGVIPAYIAVGAAAGVRRYLAEAGLRQSVETAGNVLEDISKLDACAPLGQMILNAYRLLLDSSALEPLRRAADAVKAASIQNVI